MIKRERRRANDKEKLIKLITDCGGRIRKDKLKPGEKNPLLLKKLSVDELKKIAEEIEMRDSERYEFNEIKLGKNGKYTTRNNQDDLKDVIKS